MCFLEALFPMLSISLPPFKAAIRRVYRGGWRVSGSVHVHLNKGLLDLFGSVDAPTFVRNAFDRLMAALYRHNGEDNSQCASAETDKQYFKHFTLFDCNAELCRGLA